jgi:hypothetical protein
MKSIQHEIGAGMELAKLTEIPHKKGEAGQKWNPAIKWLGNGL